MKKLNENESKALGIICNDCDDIDGEGFTRLTSIIGLLVSEFKNGHAAGGYLTQLAAKGYVDIDPMEDEVWVGRDVYSAYC